MELEIGDLIDTLPRNSEERNSSTTLLGIITRLGENIRANKVSYNKYKKTIEDGLNNITASLGRITNMLRQVVDKIESLTNAPPVQGQNPAPSQQDRTAEIDELQRTKAILIAIITKTHETLNNILIHEATTPEEIDAENANVAATLVTLNQTLEGIISNMDTAARGGHRRSNKKRTKKSYVKQRQKQRQSQRGGWVYEKKSTNSNQIKTKNKNKKNKKRRSKTNTISQSSKSSKSSKSTYLSSR